MEIMTAVPRFELRADEATPERLMRRLSEMAETDWLLLHQVGAGYRCFLRPEVKDLLDRLKIETKTKAFVGEIRVISLETTWDPIVHLEEGDEELKIELEKASAPRGRALQVTSKGVQVASLGTPSPASLSDIGLFVPPGEAPATPPDLCPRLEPGKRREGQPFLERNHRFTAVPGVHPWVCEECLAECKHLAEHRLRSGACGRCGRPGGSP